MISRRRPSAAAALRALRGIVTFDAVIGWATRLSPREAWGVTLLAVALATALDVMTGSQIWVGPIYLVIICLPAWSLGQRAGFIAGMGCAAISVILNGTSNLPAGEIIMAWNAVMRIMAVTLIVMLVSGFRRSHDREWRHARHDRLTGALTRQAMIDRIASTRRQSGCSVLAYIDLDGFKQVNDRHGHAAGDAVLREFAAGVHADIREADSFARIGGDEFLLHMRVEDARHGRRAAEAMHSRLNTILGGTPYALRCSMGAVVLSAHARVDETAIAEADRLMYVAKRAGGALRVASSLDAPARPAPRDRRQATTAVRRWAWWYATDKAPAKQA